MGQLLSEREQLATIVLFSAINASKFRNLLQFKKLFLNIKQGTNYGIALGHFFLDKSNVQNVFKSITYLSFNTRSNELPLRLVDP